MALANLALASLEFTRANPEYERALSPALGNTRVLSEYDGFAALMGRAEAGLAAAHRSVMLDPLNPENHYSLGEARIVARRYGEAIVALTDAEALDLWDAWFNSWLGEAYYLVANFQSARATCESQDGDRADNHTCLAAITPGRLLF